MAKDKVIKVTNPPVPIPDEELLQLADKIVQVIEEGKQSLAISINEIVKTTYWKIGQYIVEFEQQGNVKAKYGTSMLSNLAKVLRARVGRGYSRPNLNNMRKFYLMYPICQTSDKSGLPILKKSEICQTSDKLTWSHICELITIDDPLEREFYEKECVAHGWSVDTLHRQKESGLFMRLALSKDKEGILALAHEGQRKRGAVKHKDIGQMNMYLGYFAKEENMEGDNPPIGIIMSHYKDELMVEYATYGMDSNLFVSKYELYLPNKEDLRKMVKTILK